MPKAKVRATDTIDEEMADDYDFSNGVRGKYAQQLNDRVIMVTIDPDLAEVFRNSEEVNRALRLIVGLGELAHSLDTRRMTAAKSEHDTMVLAEEKAKYGSNPQAG